MCLALRRGSAIACRSAYALSRGHDDCPRVRTFHWPTVLDGEALRAAQCQGMTRARTGPTRFVTGSGSRRQRAAANR
jgi:hypothetical protein